MSQAQSLALERVHTSCLRSILGVKLSDCHSNAHVRALKCGATTLATIISTNRLRWLGHVGRMEHGMPTSHCAVLIIVWCDEAAV
jgi:hypothetical protein